MRPNCFLGVYRLAALVIAAIAVKEGRDAWQGPGLLHRPSGASQSRCVDRFVRVSSRLRLLPLTAAATQRNESPQRRA